MAARKAWSPAENWAVALLYRRMLKAATSGQPYNKRAMLREAMAGQLSERSKGSIEFKLMNCSAAHAQLDPEAVTMADYGYKALPNTQKVLKDSLAKALKINVGE